MQLPQGFRQTLPARTLEQGARGRVSPGRLVGLELRNAERKKSGRAGLWKRTAPGPITGRPAGILTRQLMRALERGALEHLMCQRVWSTSLVLANGNIDDQLGKRGGVTWGGSGRSGKKLVHQPFEGFFMRAPFQRYLRYRHPNLRVPPRQPS
jgi:hypothetical protein